MKINISISASKPKPTKEMKFHHFHVVSAVARIYPFAQEILKGTLMSINSIFRLDRRYAPYKIEIDRGLTGDGSGEAIGKSQVWINPLYIRPLKDKNSSNESDVSDLVALLVHEFTHLWQEQTLESGQVKRDSYEKHANKRWKNRPWEQEANRVAKYHSKRIFDDLQAQGVIPHHFKFIPYLDLKG